jgi:transcription factor C subunit 7
METLHDRIAYTMDRVIRTLDKESNAPRSLLICTHAASMIVLGRVLTGKMPESPFEDDFRCGTCSLSVFKRTGAPNTTLEEDSTVQTSKDLPALVWKGVGVAGGWTCEVNGDCSFLAGGEERGW